MRASILERPAHMVEPEFEPTPPRSLRPGFVWLLVTLLGLLVVSGFDGGLAFITDRTGASLGAKLSWLVHTPVKDFFLPGLFLLIAFGIGGLVLMAGAIWHFSPGPLRRLDRALGYHWSWAGSIALGSVLVMWIVYELFVLPETTFLQPVLIAIGLLIAGLPLLPSMRRWYSVGNTDPR
jgi:hypothetical protein